MNKRSIKIISTISTVLILLLGYNHCVVQQNNGKNKSSSSESDSSTSTPTAAANDTLPETIEDQNVENPNIIVAQTVEVGVKNYEQILNTMAVLTGVSLEDREIRNTYADVKDQLPTSNDIKSFQSANQVAILKLASEFCNELVNSEELRSNIWREFNFGQRPSSILNADGWDFIIERSIDHFWMISEEEYSIKVSAQAELSSLITDLLAEETQDSSAVTRDIVKGVCISTLGSIHAVML